MFGLIKRPFVGRWFGLVLDGNKNVGMLRSVEGGTIKADAVVQQGGGLIHKMKGIGLPSYEPITVSVPTHMSPVFWEWIEASMEGKHERKNGSILFYDPTMTVVHEMEFKQALITECGFGNLDASSKDPYSINVKFIPEVIVNIPDPGTKHAIHMPPAQKRWTSHNFDFGIDGFKKIPVSKVEGLQFTQKTKPFAVGSQRWYQQEPVSIDFPNIKVSVPLAFAKPYYEWVDKLITKGHNAAKHDKTGHITMFTSDFSAENLRVDLHGVEIVSIGMDKSDTNTDKAKNAIVELSVERLKLKYHT
jgi:phage tail-like protein